MKKAVASLGICLATVCLFAGGDLAPVAPVSAPIKASCTTSKVYLDQDSGLMWQDAPFSDAEDSAYSQNRSFGKAGTLQHAIQYCKRLNYAGFADWRLPTADELMEIHHHSGQHFVNFRDRDFWSSTVTTEGKFYAVYPADAYRYKRSKHQSNYIRCVRCAGK